MRASESDDGCPPKQILRSTDKFWLVLEPLSFMELLNSRNCLNPHRLQLATHSHSNNICIILISFPITERNRFGNGFECDKLETFKQSGALLNYYICRDSAVHLHTGCSTNYLVYHDECHCFRPVPKNSAKFGVYSKLNILWATTNSQFANLRFFWYDRATFRRSGLLRTEKVRFQNRLITNNWTDRHQQRVYSLLTTRNLKIWHLNGITDCDSQYGHLFGRPTDIHNDLDLLCDKYRNCAHKNTELEVHDWEQPASNLVFIKAWCNSWNDWLWLVEVEHYL